MALALKKNFSLRIKWHEAGCGIGDLENTDSALKSIY